MAVIGKRYFDLIIVSVNAVWSQKAQDYLLHVIYRAVLVPNGKYYLYEAYITI